MAQILIIVALAILGGGAYYYTQEYKSEESEMHHDHDHSEAIVNELTFEGALLGTATFLPNEKLELKIEGVNYHLNQVRTASGIRYETSDGSLMYMEHQGDITIETPEVTYTEVSATHVSGDMPHDESTDTNTNVSGETSMPAEGSGGVVVYSIVDGGEEQGTVVFNGSFVEVGIEGEVYRLDQVDADIPGTLQYETSDGAVIFVEGDNQVDLTKDGITLASDGSLEVTERTTTPAFDAMIISN
jgi:hypothetical protein